MMNLPLNCTENHRLDRKKGLQLRWSHHRHHLAAWFSVVRKRYAHNVDRNSGSHKHYQVRWISKWSSGSSGAGTLMLAEKRRRRKSRWALYRNCADVTDLCNHCRNSRRRRPLFTIILAVLHFAFFVKLLALPRKWIGSFFLVSFVEGEYIFRI